MPLRDRPAIRLPYRVLPWFLRRIFAPVFSAKHHASVPPVVEAVSESLGLPFAVNEKRKSWMIRKES